MESPRTSFWPMTCLIREQDPLKKEMRSMGKWQLLEVKTVPISLAIRESLCKARDLPT